MPTLATANVEIPQRSPLSLEQARLLQPAEFDEFVEGRMRFLAENLELQLPLHRLTVMDFACGVGDDSNQLREQLRPQTVIGFDVDRAALEVAEQRYYGSRFHSWTADATDIAPESIDVVFAVGLLQSRSTEEQNVLSTSRFIHR